MPSAEEIQIGIVLNGLDDIIAQLQAAGQAGSEAFEKIAAAAAQLSGHPVAEHLDRTRESAEGANEAVKSLAETGTRAFTGLSESAEKFSGAVASLSPQEAVSGFTALGEAVEGVAEHLGSLGKAAALVVGSLTAVTAAVAGATFGLYELAKSGAEATIETEELARAAGTSISNMEGMQAAFAAAGASTENFASQMRILSMQISAAWPEIQRQVRDSADKMEEDQIKIREAQEAVAGSGDQMAATFIKVKEASIGLEEAQLRVANSQQAIKTAQDNVVQSGQRILDIRLQQAQAATSVEQAEYNLERALGAPRDKQREQLLRIEQAENALAAAKRHEAEVGKEAARVADEQAKAQVALQNAYLQQKREMLGIEQAQIALSNAQREAEMAADKQELAVLRLREAQNKYHDDLLKDIPTVQAALRGENDQIKLTEVSVDTLTKAIIANAGEMAAAAKGLTGAIKPSDFDVMLELSKAFQTVTDEQERAALARRTMGRTVSQAEIDAIAKGPEYLRAWREAEEKAGFSTEALGEKAEKFMGTLNLLMHHLDVLRQQMASPFTEIFTEGMEKLNAFIVKHRAEIVAWATDLATKLRPVILDIFNLLTGEEIKTPWLKKLVDDVVSLWHFLEGLIGVINSVVEATIGWGNAVKIIIGLKLLAWVSDLISPVRLLAAEILGLGVAGEKAAAGGLAALSLRLAAIGAIIALLWPTAANVGEEEALRKAREAQQPKPEEPTPEGTKPGETTPLDDAADKQKDAAKDLSTAGKDLQGAAGGLAGAGGGAPGGGWQPRTAEEKAATGASLEEGWTQKGIQEARERRLGKDRSAAVGAGGPGGGGEGQKMAWDSSVGMMVPAHWDAQAGGYVSDYVPWWKRPEYQETPEKKRRPRDVQLRDPRVGEPLSHFVSPSDRVNRPFGAAWEQSGYPEGVPRGGAERGEPFHAEPREPGPGERLTLEQRYGGEPTEAQLVERNREQLVAPFKALADMIADALGLHGPRPSEQKVFPEKERTREKFIEEADKGLGLSKVLDDFLKEWKAANDDFIAKSTGAYGDALRKHQQEAAGATPTAAATHARGGEVHGPGTSTSDSVPIMASAGEFVMNAAAVQHYGSRIMHGLNNMQISPHKVFGMALGGLVPDLVPMPRLAAGGPVNVSAEHYALDLRTDHGTFPVSAGEQTMSSIRRTALNSKMTSLGTQPSWKR